jgi:hypothetical protein
MSPRYVKLCSAPTDTISQSHCTGQWNAKGIYVKCFYNKCNSDYCDPTHRCSCNSSCATSGQHGMQRLASCTGQTQPTTIHNYSHTAVIIKVKLNFVHFKCSTLLNVVHQIHNGVIVHHANPCATHANSVSCTNRCDLQILHRAMKIQRVFTNQCSLQCTMYLASSDFQWQ